MTFQPPLHQLNGDLSYNGVVELISRDVVRGGIQTFVEEIYFQDPEKIK
jgi:hypothetical protein